MNNPTVIQTWPVIGHDWAVNLLRREVAAGHPPHALLITGPPNVGKGTLALSFAQTLLCTGDPQPCGVCRACRLVVNRGHPDLYWIEPEGASLKIDQIRELTRQLMLAPLEGPRQIAVLDTFERATLPATDALLKTLEEPPSSVILVLLAQQAEALLPTIVSRCQVIALRPVPRSAIEHTLIAQWGIEAERARLLSHISGGRPGWALTAAGSPELLVQRDQKLDDFTRLLHSARVDRFSYAGSLARQAPESILETLEHWIGWWRDMLLLTSHSSVPLTNVDRQHELEQVAIRCDVTTAQSALIALQTTVDQLSKNANTRLALEILFLSLPYLA